MIFYDFRSFVDDMKDKVLSNEFGGENVSKPHVHILQGTNTDSGASPQSAAFDGSK